MAAADYGGRCAECLATGCRNEPDRLLCSQTDKSPAACIASLHNFGKMYALYISIESMLMGDHEAAQQRRRRVSLYDQQTGDVHAPGRPMVSVASGLLAHLG